MSGEFLQRHYVVSAQRIADRKPALVECLCCGACFAVSAPLPTRDEVLRLLRHTGSHVAPMLMPPGAVTAARMTGIPRTIGRA